MPIAVSSIRIFIVDDHPLVREWLAQLLRGETDFEVVGQADDAAPAMEGMRATPADIAIVDLSLKSGSGLDLIKQIREELPGVQVIVLSMHEEMTQVERALRAGAVGYVMKRESTTRIVEAIRRRDPDEAEAWTHRHFVDFQRGYRVARLDVEAPVDWPEQGFTSHPAATTETEEPP